MLFPTLYPAIILDTGWSRATVMSFASFKFASSAVFALVAGFLVHKIGERFSLLAASIAMSIALTGFYFMESVLVYYALAIVFGFATVATSVSIKTLVSHWFAGQQGKALGFTLVGAGIGAAISPLVAETMLLSLPWRHVVAAYGLVVLLASLPFIPLVAAGKPSTYGASAYAYDPVGTRHSHKTEVANPVPLSAIMRSSKFLLISLAVFITGFADQAITQLTKTYLQLDIGYSGMVAASMISAILAISIIFRVVFGWLYDRYSLGGVAICLAVSAISILSCLTLFGPLTLALFVLLRGAAHGGRVIQVPLLAKHVFGDQHLPKFIGIFTSIYSFGMAIGPFFSGLLFDLQGTYLWVFLICAAAQMVAITAVLAVQTQLSREMTVAERLT